MLQSESDFEFCGERERERGASHFVLSYPEKQKLSPTFYSARPFRTSSKKEHLDSTNEFILL